MATLIDDCSYWQVVWLDPRAVRPRDVGPPARRVLGWEELREQPETPPVEPVGALSPVREAAVSAALAHLLAASGGARVVVPGGPVAGAFRPALDALLPAGPPTRNLALAGPGLPPGDRREPCDRPRGGRAAVVTGREKAGRPIGRPAC
ncbi:hypothetical protein AB0G16_33540, partial [Streptosporangium sp. NPDC023615]